MELYLKGRKALDVRQHRANWVEVTVGVVTEMQFVILNADLKLDSIFTNAFFPSFCLFYIISSFLRAGCFMMFLSYNLPSIYHVSESCVISSLLPSLVLMDL